MSTTNWKSYYHSVWNSLNLAQLRWKVVRYLDRDGRVFEFSVM